MAKASNGKARGIRPISLDALVELVAAEIGEPKDEVRRFVINNMPKTTARQKTASALKKHCAKVHP